MPSDDESKCEVEVDSDDELDDNMELEYKYDDEFEGEVEFELDEEFKWPDAYPAVRLVKLTTGLNTPQEYHTEYKVLNALRAKDYTFKNKMYNDENLKHVYNAVIQGTKKASAFEKDDKYTDAVKTIEEGMKRRKEFVIRQRRLVAGLHETGYMLAYERAWLNATIELARTIKIISRWDTKNGIEYLSELKEEEEKNVHRYKFLEA